MAIIGNTIQLFPNIVSVQGEEARKFLQAVISADISELARTRSQYSLLLSPSGKTMFAMLVYCLEDDHFLLLNEGSIEGTLTGTLSKFLIRTKAEIKDVSLDYQVGLGFSIASENVLRQSDRKIADNVFGDTRLNMVLKRRHSFPIETDALGYENLRISHGAVSLIKDLRENSIAQEAGLDRSSISFNKGCFIGQELVCRIDSREASTPFTYFALKVDDYESIDYGQVYCGEDMLGEVTSSINYKLGHGLFSTYFGEFNAIAKITRKGASQLQEFDCEGFYVQTPLEQKYAIYKIQKSNGYFRI